LPSGFAQFLRQKGNSMTRQEIIDVFIVRTAPAGRPALRQQLDKMSKDELETAYEFLQIQEEIQVKKEQIVQIRIEAAAERAIHQHHAKQAREPQRLAEEKAQLEQDRKTFADAARSLRSFAVNDANFNVIKQTLGEGFSVFAVQQMVAANGATLSPPTQEELNEWDREAIEAHNLRLLSADIPTLRKLAREAGARGPAAPQPDETQRVRAAERADGVAYPPLPDEFRDGNNPEEVLNAAFIKKCSKETLQLLIKRYGSEQINEALRTRVSGVYSY
jgi:hypothetical protein